MSDLKNYGLPKEETPHISVKILSLIGVAVFFVALLFSHTFTWN